MINDKKLPPKAHCVLDYCLGGSGQRRENGLGGKMRFPAGDEIQLMPFSRLPRSNPGSAAGGRSEKAWYGVKKDQKKSKT